MADYEPLLFVRLGTLEVGGPTDYCSLRALTCTEIEPCLMLPAHFEPLFVRLGTLEVGRGGRITHSESSHPQTFEPSHMQPSDSGPCVYSFPTRDFRVS